MPTSLTGSYLAYRTILQSGCGKENCFATKERTKNPMNNEKQLAQDLIDRGIIDEGQRLIAEHAISWGIRQKGIEGVTEKIRLRTKRITNADYVLRLMFDDLPDIPPTPYIAHPTIEDEMEQEEQDKRELEILKENGIGREHFARYEDLPHVKVEAYRVNTWITVYEEAKAENTSMHEICRRKGLDYRSLIA